MILGRKFNEQFKNTSFVKLTNENCIHNGFKYEERLNKDTIPLHRIDNDSPGGLYFCKYDEFGKWCNYGNKKMEYMWDVEIPNDAKVVMIDGKFKSNKIILSNKRLIWSNNDLCLEAVKHDGFNIKHVYIKDPDMCLEAVKQNGLALYFIKIQTEEMCLTAVKNNTNALGFVQEQTESICLEVVKTDGLALRHVKTQTEEICSEAIKQNGFALKFVKNQTDKLCLEAVAKDGMLLCFVKAQNDQICSDAVTQTWKALRYVRNQTNHIQLIAIKQDISSVTHMSESDKFRHWKNNLCEHGVSFKNLFAFAI